MASIVGNDIASFQGDVNYDVYKNNTNFVIFKATEGVGFRDSKCSRNQTEARRVGLPLGYYHFARPDLNVDAIKEAQYFLDQIGALRDGEVLALDYETPKKQSDVDWCKKWLDHVFQKTNCRPLIYMSESYVTGLNWQVVVDGGYGLWIAKYTIPPSPNSNFNDGQWPFAAMYQWSSSQKVPGILNGTGNVDANVFFGDVATFKKYGYKSPTPPPPPTDYKKLYEDEKKKTEELTKQLKIANEKIATLETKILNAQNALS